MKTKPLTTALIAGGVLALGTAGAFTLNQGWMTRAGAPSVPATAAGAADVQVAVAGNAAPAVPTSSSSAGQMPGYRAIVEQYGPAVVGVTVAGTQGAGAEGQGGGRGQGSGFIISADGLILTNAHVVRDAREVTVKLGDRSEYPAKVLGSDPVTDVAVLRIDAKNLPTVRLGNPKDLRVGDPVLAIGAPFGFEQTATQGIVSAKGRSLPGDAVVPFIQTDAAVNPGNSGGPLFNGNGDVIGINAQIYSHTGGYQGLAFAIPIDVALKVKDQIVATGKATHGRLGVMVQDLTAPLAESFGLKRPDGALVSQVAPGSAAAAAGLKPGDVITHVNGEALTRSGALSSVIGLSAPGEKVRLGVWREHKAIELEARLGGATPADEAVADRGSAAQGPRLGLALRPLQPQEKQQAGLAGGLVVEQVSGAAERAGIEAGDVLLAINGKPVTSIEQIRDVLKSQPKSVALLVQRQGDRIFVPVPLG
jgi:serine protease Do